MSSRSVARSAISPPMAVKTSTNWATAPRTAAGSGSPAPTRWATAWRSPGSRVSPALAVRTWAAAPVARAALAAKPAATASAASAYAVIAASASRPPSPKAVTASSGTSVRTSSTGPWASPGTTGVPCSCVADRATGAVGGGWIGVTMTTVNVSDRLTVNRFGTKTTDTQIRGPTGRTGSAMYAAERHQAIADLVSKRNRVSVTELASHFDVTTETVRRDLSTLERLKLVRRVHGGAVSVGSLTVLEAKLPERGLENADQKDAIARAALDLLPAEGGTLVLDAGSTTVRLAGMLPSDRQWTVITNAVPIASLLAPLTHVELQLLPGRVRSATQAAVGHATIEALGHFRADLAFVGTNGLTVAHGFSTPDPEEAATKHAMVGSALRVVALADASKVGQERTVRFARVDEVDVLVTDTRIDPADVEQLAAAGLEIVEAS